MVERGMEIFTARPFMDAAFGTPPDQTPENIHSSQLGEHAQGQVGCAYVPGLTARTQPTPFTPTSIDRHESISP